MFWTNSTNAWRYYVILRNNLRWVFAGFLDCFLTTSWRILGSSWWFLKTSCWFLTTFSPPESSSLLKIPQDATETPSRSLWDANKTTKMSSRSDKICQIVTNIFEIFKKILGASRFIKNCQEVSRSCSRSLQEAIKKCQDLKFCTIRVELRESGTALDGQPEIHQIINTN